MPPILDIDALSVRFTTRAGDIPAVSEFSCRIGPGEVLGLVGESGCGKSTVALAILRDLGRNGRISAGTIRFRGRDLATLSTSELRRIRGAEIAMIYQEPMASLNPSMKIGAQLAEVPMLHRNLSRRAALDRAREMIADVRLPDPDRILNAYPHQLSGGQQQRIVIAMALMARPALLILDEPTTALDVTVEAGIIDLVRGLGRKYGTAMLFISHNLGLVRDVCDRITVMYAGEAVESGKVATVFQDMRHPYTRALFDAIPRPASDRITRPLRPIPGTLPLPRDRPPGCSFGPRCDHFQAGRCDAGPVPLLPAGAGHDSRCLRLHEIDWQAVPPPSRRPPRAPLGEVLLRAEDLRKCYPGPDGRPIRANESISFSVRAGETFAIVGESGCGKSTLAKLITGLETASSGRLLLEGQEIQSLPVERRPRALVAGLQMVFQNPFDTLNPSMTVGRQILRALERFGRGDSREDRRNRMRDLLDLVKLPAAIAARRPRQLSGGQKQRVGIARAFAGEARIVVADEPVSALDVSVQAAVTELLGEIQRDHGTTLVLISHDLSIVRYLADRVMVMYLGHVVELGTTDQVFARPHHPYTEALLSAVPQVDPGTDRKPILLEGDMPSALAPPPGCPFQTRCHRRHLVPGDRCATELPPLHDHGGHQIRCHLDAAVLVGCAEDAQTRSDAPAPD
ncbi:dipeptide ABC transporter ATP-binding protein [Plastorhodobacter daqingensis]|uniref:Dipeptide ABC transporter ATP-binding protein n=1 Tax=Plastorhodobacter daqingensis TaxID=1387281 RepID=A0ABW2UKK6_9RHOB